jgi:glycosyltransferase involved in cell wall biosynthesis/LmbE family N-acetylglucosaminyl deacetylase/SAM-dependent methyltransferase
MNGGATSGVGSQVRMLAHGLIDAGNSISIIDLADSDQVIVKDDRGAEVHRMRGGNLHWLAGKLPLAGKVLALPIREIEYSIAVWRGVRRANKLSKLDLIEGTETGMLLVAMFSRATPVIIRLHGEQYTFHKYTPGMRLTLGVRLSRVLQRIALRRAKLLISPSLAHAHEIQRELGKRHPPIVVVPNGLNVRSMERDSEIQRGLQTVLYVGRIERRKGISTLLQAASQTREAFPQSQFVFAGDFHSSLSESEFQSLVRQHGLDSHVELLGAVGWKVLSDWYQRSTVSVLPSHYETFGLAALEPMAFGTPVIATSGGALSEVVESEVSGKLVAAGDAGALAGAMTELLANVDSREQMSKAAFKRAAIFDMRRVLPLNSRPYEWCRETDWSEGTSHLFFSPHLDDVVLSCGGMIDSLVSRNKSVQVITVFAGDSDEAQVSAFARHLHAKAGSTSDLFEQRRQEDAKALGELGVRNVERWNFTEGPYRRGRDGKYLYGSYDELRGEPALEDQSLRETITERVMKLLEEAPDSAVLYFPLSLGRHVDHQLLFAIGLQLSAAGKRVRFYEDYPYAEAYDPDHRELNWLPRTVSIDLESKLKAAAAYATQIRGLGGSIRNLEKRLRNFGVAVGGQSLGERYWEVVTPVSFENGNQTANGCPLVRKDPIPGLRDFKNFLRTFRWHDLEEVLPVGSGRCLDLDCGEGRHRRLIESEGYHWLGLDRSESATLSLQSDGASLPFQSESMAALVAWQVFEYFDRPEAVIAEAARVLEAGGVFCGSVSFLKPVHGRTCFNMSPLILKDLLGRHGFADIEIKPGLNGFALTLWTWLRRSGIPLADHLAIPAAFALLAPLAAVMFVCSWLAQRMRFGSGHTMRWISQTSLLKFAGNVMFTARKKARAESCTSVS